MTEHIYEFSKPLMITLKSPAGAEAVIDVAMASERIGEIRERVKTDAWAEVGPLFRPWLAQRLEMDPEDLSLGQVAECGDTIIKIDNESIAEIKKKRSTILSSLSSIQESQADTSNGQSEQSKHGSEATQDVRLGATGSEA